MKSSKESIASSESSSDSLLYRIIEEHHDVEADLDHPRFLKDLTEKLNNDVSNEIFLEKKRQSVIDGESDLVMAQLQENMSKNFNGYNFESNGLDIVKSQKSGNNKGTLYDETSNWMDINEIQLKADEAGFEDDEHEAEMMLMMMRPSIENAQPMSKESNQKSSFGMKSLNRSNSRLRASRFHVRYQPHPNLNDDINSYYSSRTYAAGQRRNASKFGSVKNFNNARFGVNNNDGKDDDMKSYYSLRYSILGGRGGDGVSERSRRTGMTLLGANRNDGDNNIYSREIYNLIMDDQNGEVKNPRNENDRGSEANKGLLSKFLGW